MEFQTQRPFLVMELVVLSCLIGLGPALHIETTPSQLNPSIHHLLNLTCVVDRSGGKSLEARDVVLIQIERPDQKPIAGIELKHGLTMGPESLPNMQADGHIDNGASYSYLTVTIHNPTAQDGGPYACVLFYLDGLYQLLEDKTVVNVTVDSADTTDIVATLVERVSNLENANKDLQNKSKGLEQTVQELKMANKDLQNKSKGLEQTVQELKMANKDLQNKSQGFEQTDQELKMANKDLQKKSKGLEQTVQELKMANKDLQNKSQGFEQTDQELKMANQDLQKKNQDFEQTVQELKVANKDLQDTSHTLEQKVHIITEQPTCAFSVTYSNDQITQGDNLKFPNVITNIGDAYDTSTGLFTAPHRGIYVFHLVAMTWYAKDTLKVSLKVNGIGVVARLYARDDDASDGDQSSVTSVVTLNPGDTMVTHVESYNHIGDNNILAPIPYTVFSGFLLKALQ